MKAFRFVRPTSYGTAVTSAASEGAVFKAGGMDLLDHMKERLDEPDSVVALAGVEEFKMRAIFDGDDGALEIGALVTLAELASSDGVSRLLPALTVAAHRAASPQIRNVATLGGNLCQHTRCGYYRHKSFPCVKRGDTTCPVLEDGAVQDTAGIFGNRPCASAHPASIPPVLAAADAVVVVLRGKTVERIPFASFYRAPERGRASDTVLEPGDLVVAVEIPPAPADSNIAYEEVRQKAEFDWALVSCAVRVTQPKVAGRIVVSDARVWLGSVAPTPYRAEAAEKALVGKTFSESVARAAGDAAASGATPLPGNEYKVDLVKVLVRRASMVAGGRS